MLNDNMGLSGQPYKKEGGVHMVARRITKVCIIGFFCFVSLFAGLCFGTMYSQASSNLATGFYRSDFVSGVAASGPPTFAAHQGYSYSIYSDSSTTNWKNKTQSSKVEFIHTHGNNGFFTLTSSLKVTGNGITGMTFTNTPKLIYISACYTGNGSTTYGNVGQALVNKGTNAVVAFKNTISASTGTNGIHKFNQKVATKLAYSHYTLSNSLAQALNEIYAEDGQYWGANYKVVYGNGSISF